MKASYELKPVKIEKIITITMTLDEAIDLYAEISDEDLDEKPELADFRAVLDKVTDDAIAALAVSGSRQG